MATCARCTRWRGALPLVLPAAADALDAATLIAAVDGVVLTGGPSNVGRSATAPSRCRRPR